MARGPEDAVQSTPGSLPNRAEYGAFRDAHSLELHDVLARIEVRIRALKAMLADHREEQRRRFPGEREDREAPDAG